MTPALADPPGDGVIRLGEKFTVTPEGAPLDIKATGLENPLMDDTVIVADPDPPG